LDDEGLLLVEGAYLHLELSLWDGLTELNPCTPVGILAWLHYPEVLELPFLGHFLEALLELKELWVLDSMHNVESQWDEVKGVQVQGFIVHLHVHKERLLVGEMEVILHLPIDLYHLWALLFLHIIGVLSNEGIQLGQEGRPRTLLFDLARSSLEVGVLSTKEGILHFLLGELLQVLYKVLSLDLGPDEVAGVQRGFFLAFGLGDPTPLLSALLEDGLH